MPPPVRIKRHQKIGGNAVRYGVVLPNFGAFSHPRALAALAREAEAAGWDGFFLWDHVMFGSYPTVDPWIALSAVAMTTERMRIGTMVTPLARRRPVQLARETVSLDLLSNGRLILGAGSGRGPWEWEHLGDEPDLRVRAEMLDEQLELLTAMWSGEPVSHRGKHYTVDVTLPGTGEHARFLPSPVQSPRIPIWIAGEWPAKAPFRRAARWDGVAPIMQNLGMQETMRPDDLRAIVAYVRAQRTSEAPFDVVTSGFTDGADPGADARLTAAYADAGATWWLENISPWRFGWQWQGPWPADAMAERIRRGPPPY